MPLAPFVVAQGVVGSMIAKMIPLSIAGDTPRPLAALHRRRAGGRRGLDLHRLADEPACRRRRARPPCAARSPGAASVMTIMSEFRRRRHAAGRLHAVSARSSWSRPSPPLVAQGRRRRPCRCRSACRPRWWPPLRLARPSARRWRIAVPGTDARSARCCAFPPAPSSCPWSPAPCCTRGGPRSPIDPAAVAAGR